MPERRIGRWFARTVGVLAVACTTCVPLPQPGGGSTEEGLLLSTGTLPTGEAGNAYLAIIEATGGVEPYTFARTRGDPWPAGLELDTQTGEVIGTPKTAAGGAYFVDVSVTDSSDPPLTHERRLTLIIFERGNEYSAIRAWILPTCSASACHSAPTHAADLVLEPEVAFSNIVDVPPSNPFAVANGKLLVEPGNPTNSFFLSKITGDLETGEGTMMPQAGVVLSDEQVALVRQWVEQGALPAPDEDVGGGDSGTDEPQGPSLEIGETIEQIYAPLKDGDDLLVWFGTQGGVWVIPTVRATGLDTTVTVEAELTSVDGSEVLGGVSFPTDMTPTLDGTELQNITVPIFNDFDVESLFGAEAILSFTIQDDEGNEVSLALTLILQPA